MPNQLFSEKINVGKRTYFFDVNIASNGNKYLNITESKPINGKYKRDKIIIFEDQIQSFLDGFKVALKVLRDEKNSGTAIE